jgi:hypothetical protein
MDDRRMQSLSIMYRVLRCLIALIAQPNLAAVSSHVRGSWCE